MIGNEQKQNPRKRVLFPAKIYFNNKQSVFDCTVTDLSGAGAHLKMISTLGVPDIFTLFIPSTDERFTCRVVWSNMKEVGVSFHIRDVAGEPDLRIVREKC